MSNNIDEQMDEIKSIIEDLPVRANEMNDMIDLRLKYVIAETLISIRQQLYEINHYGIGPNAEWQ